MEDKKIIVTISQHQWLDCSVSWFVYINGIKSGGECYSKKEADGIARSLAKKLGCIYDEHIRKTNELFI